MKNLISIPGYPDVRVSRDGRVFRIRDGLEPFEYSLWTDRDGYKNVTIKRSAGGIKVRKHFKVHRLVYQAFKGELIDGLVVCHRNGDPADNRDENLMQATHTVNHSHKREHGTQPAGSDTAMSKFTDDDLMQVMAELKIADRDTIGRLARGEVPRIAKVCGVSDRLVKRASIALRHPENNGQFDLSNLRRDRKYNRASAQMKTSKTKEHQNVCH